MENAGLRATAEVTLTKLDENGNVVSVETSSINLTDEEVARLWHSPQQA